MQTTPIVTVDLKHYLKLLPHEYKAANYADCILTALHKLFFLLPLVQMWMKNGSSKTEDEPSTFNISFRKRAELVMDRV